MEGQCPKTQGTPIRSIFDLIVQVLMAAQCAISPKEMWPADYGSQVLADGGGLKPYDFIVIGAGTAGSVVANRLSENPNWNVLVLEAGGDPPVHSEIPYFYDTLVNSPYDWNFKTEPNPNASLVLKRGAVIPRGKMLGGDSGINNMVYIRGNVEDFEYWERCGNPTWGWPNVLEFFMKSESNRYPPIAANTYSHSTTGPLPVDLFRGKDEGHSLFTGIAYDAGLDELFDANAYRYKGVLQAQGTLDHKTRSSSAKAFLIPAKGRTNLHIIKNAYVTNLKFNPDGNVAGVRFTLGEKAMYAPTSKEVILSAGAINNPKILMLSGIGPTKYLERRKIKVRTDLPVGYNFHDHIMVPFVIRVPKSYHDLSHDIVDSGFEYLAHRDGKLGSIGCRDIFTFVNTKNESDPYPNIQIGHSYYRRSDPDLYRLLQNYGYEKSIVERICTVNAMSDVGIFFISLLTPRSRGFVGIRTKDPLSPPIINTNYLGEPDDVDTLVEGIEFVRRLLNTDTARFYGAKEIKIDLKRCNDFEYASSLYWECYIRNLATSGGQPVGTTKMGSECDKESVVDWRLRVYNVRGLRVVGSSIMPRIVRAQTYATSVMIGEKGAHFITEDWTHKKHD